MAISKSFLYLLSIILYLLTINPTVSQNRAPSCWLNYNDNFPGGILINTIKTIDQSPLYTYYCALQWNGGSEGGGYCGMQEHPDGRNFIYSIWDPIASADAIQAEYIGVGTQIENFGGEGTGLKAWNFSIGWSTNNWYSFVTRIWNLNNHSHFGFWVFDLAGNIWHHIVTMDYPVDNVFFNGSTGSFIEDWMGNGWLKREVHHKEGWKRDLTLNWVPFTTSLFTRVIDQGSINYVDNYDGGVLTNSQYFMKSGGSGTFPVTNVSGTTLYLQNTNATPSFSAGEISDLTVNIQNLNLELQWQVNQSKGPQFSYYIEIYDNPAFAGNSVYSNNTIAPHIRNATLNISSFSHGTYYLKFYIKDIFDSFSNVLTTPFIIGPSITVSVDTLPSFGTIAVGSNSLPQQYSVIGNCLTSNISITSPAGFFISSSINGPWFTDLTLPQIGGVVNTIVYVQFSPSLPLPFSGNINHSSTGQITNHVFVTGNQMPSGLIAYYPFINGSFNDESGHNHHGTNFGAIATANKDGVANNAMNFDGNDDYIWLGNDPEFKQPTISIAAWFRTANSQSTQKIYRWRWYGIEMGVNLGNLYGEIYTLTTPYICTSQSNISNDLWHFATFTFDGSIARLYINGLLVDEINISDPIYYSFEGAAIGRDGDFNGSYFDGEIDDVQIYDRALLQAEINSLMVFTTPMTRNLINQTIQTGQNNCFDATQTITVAGNGTIFTVENGGIVTMIAGQKISYLPGTTVQNGGYMWGYITPNGQYCGTNAPTLPAVVSGEEEEPMISTRSSFKIFPNPTTGSFKLELSDEPQGDAALVKVYNMMGAEIFKKEIIKGRIHEFSLAGQQPGVYLIRVIQAGNVGIRKVIRQ